MDASMPPPITDASEGVDGETAQPASQKEEAEQLVRDLFGGVSTLLEKEMQAAGDDFTLVRSAAIPHAPRSMYMPICLTLHVMPAADRADEPDDNEELQGNGAVR